MMRKAKGTFLLLILIAVSCADPVPIDFPPGGIVPTKFCIDFEQSSRAEAVNGVNAALLYSDLGVLSPTNPVIFDNPALSDGAQSLFQGNPRAERPARTCGPLEIMIHPGLLAKKVEFEARNVGFISIPVLITATAFGEVDGVEVVVDQLSIVSQSTLGDLRPVEFLTLESLGSEPPITKVTVNYGTCPPHVVIDNLCITPEHSIGTFGHTDGGADRLVYYFDNRERHSYIQLANLSDATVEVHVQVWIANSTVLECEEIDLFDTYTARDVHTYDMLNITANSLSPPLSFTPDTLAGKYGFVVVSLSDGPSGSLVGAMKIIDDAGYEYRTNAVAPESASTAANLFGSVNFNNTDGNSLSELIGFTYSESSSPDTVLANGVVSVFGGVSDNILIIDKEEIITSCSPVAFQCSEGSANIGIDNSLPNTKLPALRACNTNIISAANDSGFIYMPFERSFCTNPAIADEDNNCLFDTHFVGFIGLNNGNSSGSFDSWWGGEINDDE